MVSLEKLVFGWAGFLTLVLASDVQYDLEAKVLPSACNNLEDGYHWIRPFEGRDSKGEEYPNIYVKCDKGWTILDPSLTSYFNDHQHVSKYFSSFSYLTGFAASSAIDDHVTWAEWWLPATKKTLYRTSENCNSCDAGGEYGDETVYYTTGNYIGCLWITKGYCDMDAETYECYTCTAPGIEDEVSGLCTHMESSAYRAVNYEHDDCVGTSYNAEPSIGTLGQFCVCYKPETSVEVRAAQWILPEIEEDPYVGSPDDVYHIYKSDFESGTYRVLQPGHYVLMEDIELEMNADYEEPNARGSWYPRDEQNEVYAGADGSFVGAYSMGFFAAFAVEADDVVIDLNGHTLAMSPALHLQQRWFSIIELGSKAFMSGQGPGNFGPFQTSPSRVTVKDGTIGLSSHHGIHGNGATNVTLKNLVIRDFEVGGIQMNGFDDLWIENVEIGPVYTKVPVFGVFTQARIMLERLRAVAEENPYETVRIHHRGEFSADDILDELEMQMDLVFDHFIKGIPWDERDERTRSTRLLFENKLGLPAASTVYGIFLNAEGASVFSIGGAPGYSSNAVVKNVYIHGLYNDPWEVPRVVLTKGPFNDIMDITRVSSNGMTNVRENTYIGSAYTDAQYAIHMLSDSWATLGHSVLKHSVINWISKDRKMNGGKMRCNNDIMLHVTKGIFGFRVDSIQNFEISDVIIEDLHNLGQLGSYVCGNYRSTADGGHRNQFYPLQNGYTGTEVHGMTFVNSLGTVDNVAISKVISARGDAHAMQFFPGNEISIGKVSIRDIHAGAHLAPDELPTKFMPNKIPRACAMQLWTWTEDDDDTIYTENKVTYDLEQISAKCISAHVHCDSSDFDKDVMTQYAECDGETLLTDQFAGQVEERYAEIVRNEKQQTHMKFLAHMNERQGSKHTKSSDAKAWKYATMTCLVIVAVICVYFARWAYDMIKERNHKYTDAPENNPLLEPSSYGTTFLS